MRPEEAEQALANEPVEIDYEMVENEERWTSIGHTDKLRILKLVWTLRRTGKGRDCDRSNERRDFRVFATQGDTVMKRLVAPKFKSEAEEARWWDDHMDAVGENLLEAMKKGTAHRGGPAALRRESRNITIRIANADIQRARNSALRKESATRHT